jgi:hypothetical protein
MVTFDPTQEQLDILSEFATGKGLKVSAGAGTGKTSTLTLLAESVPQSRILYLAFNKAIQMEASVKFPRNVDCRTAHSMAYRDIIVTQPEFAKRLQGGRVPFSVTKAVLDIRWGYGAQLGGRSVTLAALQRCALDAVTNFCRTTDQRPEAHHVPTIRGIDRYSEDGWGETTAAYRQLVDIVLPAARRAWDDIKRPDGVLKFAHDHYLKMWADTDPILTGYDVILFDEAQDSDPVISHVVGLQKHAQVVVVGDSNQAIYEWRGAINAMDTFEGRTLPLSESFRFGPEIAEPANGFLRLLDSDLTITGVGKPGEVTELALNEADAVLCKTNSGTLVNLFLALELGLKVHVVGGASDVKGFCRAAIDLMGGKRTSYPDLAAFSSWGEVLEYADNDPSGKDINTLITIVNEHTPQKVLDSLEASVSEEWADLVISTAHKAKGREWKRVLIHSDFERQVNKKTGELAAPSPSFLRLCYVAVTRAKKQLDLGPLADILAGE